ncbi:MAG TPA: twin-arginine translocase TatA/TatE family subunit [Flavobacteriaceae bacterium]|jgi:sec-independent protein translocase protein TatA|nr:twin-arginine translocase TatA/TatE family subunit [Flavobacteriaceae bacterium]HBS12372.1 twin-arginine translocase TatA/TatE family subunit [Flavobacteriaceae bacterium]
MPFLFISGGEIFVILIIVLMLFGADKIPTIARELGKGMRQLKDATNDIKREINKSADSHGIDTSIASDLKKEINTVKENIQKGVDEVTGPIKRNL